MEGAHRSTAALFLTFGTRWIRVVTFTLRLTCCLEITPVLIELEAAWVPEQVVMILERIKFVSLPVFEGRTVQAVASLCTDNVCLSDCPDCDDVTHSLTHSTVQSPSWEANWSAASQEIPRISRNPKVHYRTHKRPPPVSILDQPNPVHIPTSHLLEIRPNIIHPSTPRSPQWSLSLRWCH